MKACGIAEKVVVINGKVEIREMIKVAFTTDYTLIDGAPLVRFPSKLIIRNKFQTRHIAAKLNFELSILVKTAATVLNFVVYLNLEV